MNFNRVRRNYEHGLWTKKMVKDAVDCNVITEDEYHLIVGDVY